MEGGTGNPDEEPPRDPGLNQHHSSTMEDFERHRHHNIYQGLPVSSHRHKSRHHRHRHHHHGSKAGDEDRPVTPPGQRVQFILGEQQKDDEFMHETHPLFSEMETLCEMENGELEWKETARWVKFEEDVEQGGERWSKPHVSTLSLHSLFELRSIILNGTVVLDMDAFNVVQITDLLLDNWTNQGLLPIDSRDRVQDALLRKHKHLYEKTKTKENGSNMSRLPLIRSLAEIGRNHSSTKNFKEAISSGMRNSISGSSPIFGSSKKTENPSQHFDTFLTVPGSTLLIEPMGDKCQPSAPDVEEVGSSPSSPALTPRACTGNMEPPKFNRYLSVPGSRPTGLSGSQSKGSFFRNFSFSGGSASTPGDIPMDTCPSQGSIPANQSSNCLEGHEHKGNAHFMKKIPPGSEAANILVGELAFLDKPLTAFIRLSQGATLGDMTEVPVPTRFIFIMLGLKGGLPRYHEIGRAISTLLCDEVFHDVAYKAKNRNHLLAGVDEFLDAVTVLPPGEWDPAIRIEPPGAIPSQDGRKKVKKAEELDEEDEMARLRQESGLVRTGRLFGGLVNDFKRKRPWYWSDFKDAVSLQSLASFCFLYFACLTPIITFGGLLGDATGNNIAAMESLVSGLLCGVIYGLFSGQPLTILGSTGPVLVFETILYDFCGNWGWNYLAFRMWIGLWAALILMLLVALDASAAVCFITRFTEENFATLIAVIFIYKAIEKVLLIGTKYPMEVDVDIPKFCQCLINDTDGNPTYAQLPYEQNNGTSVQLDQSVTYSMLNEQCGEFNGTLVGDGCAQYYPDVYTLSLLLFFGTFIISTTLKEFKTATFFPTKVRQYISDFAVFIAIFSMSGLDFLLGIHTPKLMVPGDFKPTNPDRGWFIHPFAQNPWWSALLAFVPALLACILIFMDQQITAVIINRRENKLKKGGGYHLDMFVLAFLIAINSVMGLPWFVAATVLSINHVNSLKLESECAAPGEKPQFLGVRENRVTHIMIFIFIGLSVVMTPVLQKIPMAVLFGVFLYMGTAALKGIQFFDRILIMFMPLKYQPDYAFLRKVPLKKVHLFTIIQIICFAILWIIKSFKETSILFPLMLVVMVGVRKSLDWIFTQRELKALDDALPEFKRKEKLTDEEERLKEEEAVRDCLDEKDGMMTIQLANGNVMRVPLNPINISEEVNKSGVWKDINEDGNTKPDKNSYFEYDESCRRCRRRSRKSSKQHENSNGLLNGSAKHVHDDLEANEIDFGKKKHAIDSDTVEDESELQFSKKRGSKKDALNEDEKKRLSMMAEEEEDDEAGITIKIKMPSSRNPLKKSQSVISSETSV